MPYLSSAASPTEATDQRALKKRVLYVGEDEGARDLLTISLARRGYHVVAAASMITALLASRGQSFNLYVIDAQFWRGEGAKLCRTLRVFDPLAPFILFSAAAEPSRQEAFDAGATCYILKPDVGRLVEAVGHCACDLSADQGEGGRSVRPRRARFDGIDGV